ncbi:hypothetical protein A2U01_0069931 [Trifolium medium]|uniref:Uncharacterized protein n=1 Tax=Trifolium medium TaxID=97028 RepID=A0A392SIG7_9FABA|nr:hypothetical protein [Trifolium medium]
MHVAQRAVQAVGRFNFLLSAQRKAGAGATRSVALFFCFPSGVGATRELGLRNTQCIWSGLTFDDFYTRAYFVQFFA